MIFLIRFFLIGKTSYDIPNGVIPNFVSIFLISKQIVMFFLMIQQNVMISLLAQQIVMFFLMIKKSPEIKKKFRKRSKKGFKKIKKKKKNYGLAPFGPAGQWTLPPTPRTPTTLGNPHNMLPFSLSSKSQ